MHIMRRIPFWAAVALLVYMPFHVFLAQSLSLLTGGIEVWKAAKDVILALAVLFTICLVWWRREGDKLFDWLVGIAAIYFGLHVLLWIVNPEIYQRSAILGVVYNMRLPAFLVLGYGAVLLNSTKFVFSSVLKIVLVVSTIVALLGIAQYFLPKDIMTHVGYGLDRGTRPAFFIDDHPELPRIMSTLREPNALGAYLILPFAALLVLALKARNNRTRLLMFGSLALHGAAIALTFSRSAWLGALLASALVVWWQYSSLFVRFVKKWWPLALVATALLALGLYSQRDNYIVESYITHATPYATDELTSNDYHILFVQKGVEGVAAQPLGHGPGTAGIVSIQNPNGSFLTENYYLQIAYEVGVVGLALFAALLVLVYVRIYRRKDYVSAVLLSAFWAYAVTNMLLHTWSNEAVAAQFWLLAGMALLKLDPHKPKNKKPHSAHG